ncbi:hypothetical protein AKO1_013881 [Acrasis kona]|uniref:CBS domain-containing protein n=1 Tax=Acrasis kona TaxID=1008807 RepID=A0AAW2YL68_9EUKA
MTSISVERPTVAIEPEQGTFLGPMKQRKLEKVKDLITTQHLITAEPTETLDKVLTLLIENGKRHLPILTKTGELVGIVSERDLRMVTCSPDLDHVNLQHAMEQLSEKKVDSIMSKGVYTVDEDDSIVQAVKIMRVSKVGGLPVMRAQKVVGIVTHTDCLDHLIRILEPYN